jgi:hypothetical protein
MNQIADFFKPEILFSRQNPFLKSAEKTHRLVFETLDKTIRLQLGFTEDLLDINRERFESLYQTQSFSDLLAAQQNLASELGQRTARYAGDLQDIVSDIQSGVGEAANELGAQAKPKPKKAAGKAKKAA